MKLNLGFSTGCFYKALNNLELSNDTLKFLLSKGLNSVELSLIDHNKIPNLDNLSYRLLNKFDSVSIHCPSTIRYKSNSQTEAILDRIAIFCKGINIHSLIVHPDRVVDFTVFKKYSSCSFSFENMDSRKTTYTKLDELLLLDHNHKLTLDLQHIFTNNPDLNSVIPFFKQYHSRVSEIHISGFNKAKNHYPISITQNNMILDKLSALLRINKNLIIIIESVFDNMSQVDQEFEYIYAYLENSL